MIYPTKSQAKRDIKVIEKAWHFPDSQKYGAVKVYNEIYRNEAYLPFLESVKPSYAIPWDVPFESLSVEMKRSVMLMLKSAVSLYIDSLEQEEREQVLLGKISVGEVEAPQDEYYYCTKKIRFPKREILRHIYNFFENNDVVAAPFNEVYTYLQSALQVTSVNRQHLREFLQVSTDEIPRDKIIAMWEKYESDADGAPAVSLTSAVSLRLAEAIEVLGLEFIKSYLYSDGTTVHKFLQAFHPRKYSDRQLKIDTDLRDYILSFSETELISLLREQPDVFGLGFSEFTKAKKEEKLIKEYISQIRQSIERIPSDNHPLRLTHLLKPSVATILSQQGILCVGDFLKITDEQICYFYRENRDAFKTLISALQKNLIQELRDDYSAVVRLVKKNNKPNKDWERYCSVMYARLQGDTLAAVGERFGVTRERIRQIESKYVRMFRSFFYLQNGGRINLLRAFSSHKSYMTCEEVQALVGEYYELFIFLLDEVEGDEILYANDLNVILFEEGVDRYQEIQNYAADLPETFSDADLPRFINEVTAQNEERDIDFSEEIIKKLLLQDYTLTGTIYARATIPLFRRYDMILRDFFPNGIHIYDDDSLQKFKEAYIQIFGEDKLPKEKRAIVGRVTAISILCDKGTYIAKYSPLISDALLTDICEYIDSSEKEIFLTNTVFYCFEDRLKAEGIKNKYHLQGVLHECVGNKYYFSRDYISKSKEISSLYGAVVSYIRDAGRAVPKEEICAEFPAIPEIVLSIACQDKDIISCFGKYLHKNILSQREEEIEQLRKVLHDSVSDGAIHSCDDIMSGLNLMHPGLLQALCIDSKYTLFSIVKAFFEDEFSVSRPFIAQKGIVIGSQSDRLRAFLGEQDETDIADFIDFARDNSLSLWNVLRQINELNDEYLLKDKSTIIKIGLTGLSKYNAEYVDDFLEDILNSEEFIVGGKIHSFSLLPKIKVPWNVWLLYSVVNKWSAKYKVLTTDSQFRFSDPVFLRKEVPAENVDELINYIAQKHRLNDVQLMVYVKEQGLKK